MSKVHHSGDAWRSSVVLDKPGHLKTERTSCCTLHLSPTTFDAYNLVRFSGFQRQHILHLGLLSSSLMGDLQSCPFQVVPRAEEGLATGSSCPLRQCNPAGASFLELARGTSGRVIGQLLGRLYGSGTMPFPWGQRTIVKQFHSRFWTSEPPRWVGISLS